MAAPAEDDGSNCFFDFSLIEQFPVPGGELPSLEPDFHWSSDPFPDSTEISNGFVDSVGRSNTTKEDESRKRFQELNEILDPGRSYKTDKTVILTDAIRMVVQLRNEASQLKDSSQDMVVKINELKVEKNELRDEKQKLKADKERLEQQLKACCAPPTAFYPPAHPVMQMPPAVGGKFMPIMGFQGVPMWPFATPTAVDTSKDHVLRSPLA
ncbi:Myc-type, basic helix-loop-helix (bHLH) domain-containing protein [Cynara cardunculus var. scolymus]|uniref:Myc-type, basic helix-loop-helix (BHLH) domain-containing protein n=1 Tax=Cynara cardunculus var. scolymus TaxID=59895 RepID=A0A124SAR4_CYNCS|nr:Myc-type, basic helix-loop-helix (bHLH) domain-containing protein [Cynara cardunculus var. scolymus]